MSCDFFPPPRPRPPKAYQIIFNAYSKYKKTSYHHRRLKNLSLSLALSSVQVHRPKRKKTFFSFISNVATEKNAVRQVPHNSPAARRLIPFLGHLSRSRRFWSLPGVRQHRLGESCAGGRLARLLGRQGSNFSARKTQERAVTSPSWRQQLNFFGLLLIFGDICTNYMSNMWIEVIEPDKIQRKLNKT